jgi:hypothetical protein
MRIYDPASTGLKFNDRRAVRLHKSDAIAVSAEELPEIENIVQRTLYRQQQRADALRKLASGR